MKVSAKARSKKPRKNAATTDKTKTTMVSRAVSSRLGHTDLRSSEIVSCKNSTGFTLPAALGETGRVFRVETLAKVLPHFAVGFMSPTAGAVLAQLDPLGIIAPVLAGSVVTLPAVAALQGNNLSYVCSLSCHD